MPVTCLLRSARSHTTIGWTLDSRPPDSSHQLSDEPGPVQEVLKAEPWERQEKIALAVRDHPRVTVRSCHAAGKDWLASRLALWRVYARGRMALLTGPTAAQVEEILMRGEVRTAFVRGRLPGELHVRALRPGGGGEAGILAKTGTGISSLSGFHDARVLVVITEAQDPDIEHAWDATFACATGAEDRILTLGNPTEPDGRFYAAHRGGSGWEPFRISAADIRNVREGRTVVPGLLTREGGERFRREYAYSGEVAHPFRRKWPTRSGARGQGIGAKRRWRRDYAVAVWGGSLSGLLRRIDSPFSVMRWAWWTSRSRIASAKVASPTVWCQCSRGS